MASADPPTTRPARPKGGRATAAAPGRPRSRAPASAEQRAAAGEDRRTQILRIAARLFAEHGFERTTVREIGKAAAILSGSIYYHFATKEEMLDEIVRAPVAAMGLRMRRIAAAAADPETKVAALVLLSSAALVEDQEAFAILYNERHLFRRTPAFAYVARAKEEGYAIWHDVLAAGVEAGRFRPSPDPFMTISTIIRLLNTAADWFRHGAEHDPGRPAPTAEQVIAFNLDFIFAAIRVPGPAVPPIPREASEKLVRDARILPPAGSIP